MADLDKLANEIRRVDGGNGLGAGELAEALWPFVQALARRDGVEEPVAWRHDEPVTGTSFYEDKSEAETDQRRFGGTLPPLFAHPAPTAFGDGGGERERAPFFEVADQAYGWTIDRDGYAAGLVAGDMGYESTDMRWSDLLVEAQTAEAKALHARGGFPCRWPVHEATLGYVKACISALRQPDTAGDVEAKAEAALWKAHDERAETWVSNGGDGEYPDLVVDPTTAEDACMAGGEGSPIPQGAWKDQRLSRLDRVKAHRVELGSTLKDALEAVDEYEAQATIADRIAALRTTPADPRPDPLEALREAREALFDRYDDDKVSQALAKINAVMGEAG